MIFVDRNSVPLPMVFYSNELILARERLFDYYRKLAGGSQQRFSQPFEPAFQKELREDIAVLFHNKCAYCESVIQTTIAPGSVDHFRPKNGARGLKKESSLLHYWWLTYEWYNMNYSCLNCDRFKSTWFPVEGERAVIETPYEEIVHVEASLLVDPCNDAPEKHLVFEANGEVDFLTAKGKSTIEIFKLNRKELVSARKEVIGNLKVEWSTFQKLWVKARPTKAERDSIYGFSETWNNMFKGTSDRPYLATQRRYLSGILDNHKDILKFMATGILPERGQQVGKVSKVRNIESLTQETTAWVKSFNPSALAERERDVIGESIDLSSLKHVYLEKLSLRNFRCFSSLDIEFKQQGISLETVQNAEPWLLFLGENGVGKSSVLKAIAIALMGRHYLAKFPEHFSVEAILKKGEQEGSIALFLKGEAEPINVTFSAATGKVHTSLSKPITNLLGYGSFRVLPKGYMEPEYGRFNGIKTENLFNYSISLTDAHKWLLKISEANFAKAALTLKDLMLLGNEELIVRNKKGQKIFVQRDGHIYSIEELSDGFQSVYALAVDIMSSLIGDNVAFELAEGVVLVDEIGTHLHPRWKMQVIEQLRRSFPKIQFIVTTHEPLCLRGLRSGEAVVLIKDEGKNIVPITDLPDPAGMRADQLLTSEFFGLNSTIDPETEKLFTEYYAILSMEATDRTQEQKNRLHYLHEVIPKVKHLGDTFREDLVYYVVDELLAKKVKTEGLKMREDLKEEVKQRVIGLWDMLNEKEGLAP
jgi:uncharacterized protein (TIGR02646 family)